MHTNNSMRKPVRQEEAPLKDITKNGKERPWKARKTDNLRYTELLEILEYKKAMNVKQCAEVLEFKPTDTGHLKLYKTWFCKSKLCPLCNWRRSMKQTNQSVKIIEEVIRREPKSRWLFLTLTDKNVLDGLELKEKLTHLVRSFNRLTKYKKINKNLIGFMRKTEVTVNKTDGSYNHHLHVLLCVSSSFFKDKDNYITQTEWTNLWQKALQVDYRPIVDIRAIKPNKKKDTDINAAIKETAKYSVKSSDYLTENQERNLIVVEDLETGLHAKRLISYGGLLKKIHKEMNLEDEENYNLIETDSEDEITDEETLASSIIAKWNYEKQNYYIKK